GVGGEQFALPGAVDRLRRVRDENVLRPISQDETTLNNLPAHQPLVVASACDPVNVFGVVTPGPRVAATRRNRLGVCGGRLVASLQAGVVTLHEEAVPATTADEIQRLVR